MTSTRTFVIAEAGVNHNGSADLALQLIDAAAMAGADAVKFQTFNADKLVSPGVAKAEYQKRATGSGDQHEMLKRLELSPTLHRNLYDRCLELGIEFMSTPFDQEAADFLIALGMQRIKIASGEITNYPFLRFLASKNLPLILSTGMSSMDEICDAIDVVRQARQGYGLTQSLAGMLTVLHCTSSYPAHFDDVNLRAMQSIASVTEVPVGYSDHTMGVAVATAAVAMGATIVEKHLTLDKGLPGPDHQASLTPDEMRMLIDQIRIVERALGRPEKRPASAELPLRALVRRSVVVRRPISAGMLLAAEDICLLRPGTGIAPKEVDALVGRRMKRPVFAGALLQWDDLE